MERDLNTPSLRCKRLRGVGNVWQVRASRALRITFSLDGNEVHLRANCTHDQVQRES